MQEESTTPRRRVRVRPRVAAMKGGPSGLCAGCKATVDHLSLDHIVPWCEGGAHDLRNLQWLCRPCHKTKSKAEWYRWYERVGSKRVRAYTEEHRQKLGKAARGRTPPPEALALRSQSMKEWWQNASDEMRAAHATAVSTGHQNGPMHTGREPHSEERKRKIGEAQKRAWASGTRRTRPPSS